MVAAPLDVEVELSGSSVPRNSINGIRFVSSFDDIDSEEDDDLEADFEQRMSDIRDGLKGLEGLKEKVLALVALEKPKIVSELQNLEIE